MLRSVAKTMHRFSVRKRTFAFAIWSVASCPISSSTGFVLTTTPAASFPVHRDSATSLSTSTLTFARRSFLSSTTEETAAAATISDPELPVNMSSEEKLATLRKRMQELNLDVYLVPTDDPHLSGSCSIQLRLFVEHLYLTLLRDRLCRIRTRSLQTPSFSDWFHGECRNSSRDSGRGLAVDRFSILE